MPKAIIDEFTVEELKELVANSASMYELSLKLGYTAKGGNYKTIRNRLEKYNISTEHFTGTKQERVIRTPENTFIRDSTANQTVLRRIYIKGNYTPYKCSICGLEPFWNGKELTLTLDHINGINNDDRLENLRWVCPNCDRQLGTFSGKNRHREVQYNASEQRYCIDCGKPIGKDSLRCVECSQIARRETERPQKEELYNMLVEYRGNFTAISRKYNVSDNAIRKWCDAYNIPRRSSDYKNLKD